MSVACQQSSFAGCSNWAFRMGNFCCLHPLGLWRFRREESLVSFWESEVWLATIWEPSGWQSLIFSKVSLEVTCFQ